MAGLPKERNAVFLMTTPNVLNATAFAIKRGSLGERLDVNYWRLEPLVNRRLQNSRFAIAPLGSLLTLVQYGCSTLSTQHGPGLPMLRMTNIQHDGLNLSNLKYVTLSHRELDTYRLVPGDILINRTNSKELVGKCAVFNESGDWVFASYLVRLRANNSLLMPQFAAEFLATDTARLQIDRVSRQIIGMTNINADEIRSLCIPLPSIRDQDEFISEMEAARSQRRAKLHKAEAMLLAPDELLIPMLRISPSQPALRKSFSVTLRDLRIDGRLNPDYYHPERMRTLAALRALSNRFTVLPLTSLVTIVRKTQSTPNTRYLGLASVQSHTGELLGFDDTASGHCFEYRPDDVLFARLRPYLNKIYRADSPGCCSTEFHVLRIKETNQLHPDYLAVLLRSRLILAQTVHMASGNTHPRLTNVDLSRLQLPIPSMDVQETIIGEVSRRRGDARRLRQEAATEWRDARSWFEHQLVGTSPDDI